MLWACIVLPHLALDGVLRRNPQAGPLVLVVIQLLKILVIGPLADIGRSVAY